MSKRKRFPVRILVGRPKVTAVLRKTISQKKIPPKFGSGIILKDSRGRGVKDSSEMLKKGKGNT